MRRLATASIVILLAARSLAVQVNVQLFPASCNQCNGAAQAMVTGGVPPYSYVWSPAPPNGQGTSEIWGLCPGQWSVLVTDGLGGTATADFTIDALPGLSPFLQAQQLLFACDGQCNGWATAYENSFGGTPPYSYSWAMLDMGLMGPGSVTFQGLCAGATTITVVDAEGCTGLIQATVGPGNLFAIMASAQPACGNAANGSIVTSGPGDNNVFRVWGTGFDSLYVMAGFPPFTLDGIPAGEYSVSSMVWAPWAGGHVDEWCTAPASVTVPSLPEPCGTLIGHLYHDADEDCIENNFDVSLPYRVLGIEPGGLFTMSMANGQFSRNLPFGTFTISQGPLTDEVALCPSSGSVDFTLDAFSPTTEVEFANLSTVPHDISVQLASSAARPGFATQVWVTVSNNSAFPSGNVTVDLTYDPLLMNASMTFPLSVGVIAPYASVTLPFTANVPPNVGLLGTLLTYSATASNTASEPMLSNNSTQLNVTITGSYDPNDKRGIANTSGSDTQFFLNTDEWIDYTVRFQNTGTDTAFTVVITDTIPDELDLLSLEILGASHSFEPSIGDGRSLLFTFNDIQLPDSTTDLAGSQGFVAFRLKPVNSTLPGTIIENTANIFFDFNPPVITEPSVLVAEFSTGVENHTPERTGLLPNPATDRIRLVDALSATSALSWSIIALDGRVVRSEKGPFPSDGITIAPLRSGTYALRLQLDQGIITERFIKTAHE
ncbi:MAG: T9SS type A sorting domain-containing protein [Flavobacteriales bacterium]|nr:T9SS type A sorting domain-containing protein [Flavobacteriales bacterium]